MKALIFIPIFLLPFYFVTQLTPNVKKTQMTKAWIQKYINPKSESRLNEIYFSAKYYNGNCPCPYNKTSNGKKCGSMSAHSIAGGDSPICYALKK